MRKFITILCILIVSLNSFSQDVTGSRIIAKQSLFVKDNWVDSLRRGILNWQNDFRTLPTSGAVYNFVLANIPAGGVNIYNSNGILTNTRTLTGLNETYSLLFDSLNSFIVRRNNKFRINVDGTNTYLNSPNGNNTIQVYDGYLRLMSTSNSNEVYVRSDSSLFYKRLSYAGNIHSTFNRYSIPDIAYGDSAWGGGGGSLTVTNTGGSPSITATTLTFNSEDFVLTSPGGGNAAVRGLVHSITGENLIGGAGNSFTATGSYNTGFGNNILNSLTTGYRNTLFGSNVFRRATTISDIVGFGTDVFPRTTTGAGLTSNGTLGIGSNVGKWNSNEQLIIGFNSFQTGLDSATAAAGASVTYDNVMIGWEMAQQLRKGIDNVGIGYGNFHDLDSGNYNNAFGQFALQFLLSGENNDALGWKAGYGLVRGNQNIMIGNQSGYGSNAYMNSSIFIGADSRYTGQTNLFNVIVIGDSALVGNQDNIAVIGRSGTFLAVGRSTATESIHTDGAVIVGAAAATTDGTIQYTGSDFQGRKGGSWVSLTNTGTVTSVAAGYGTAFTTITSTGSVIVDTATMATRARVQKGIDSVAALSGSSTWNGIASPTGDQALTFQVGESSTWTDQNTTEDLFTVNNATSTTNSLFSYNRTSTALAAGNNIMELVSSGAEGASTTSTGLNISVTNTGTTSTNNGITIASSGATTNNAINVTAGRVVVPAGTSSVPALVIGTQGIFDATGVTGIGFYMNGAYRADISQFGLLMGATSSVIDIGHANFSTTNSLRYSAPSIGIARFSTTGAITALTIEAFGGEGTAANLKLSADEGDDATDPWTLQAQIDDDFAVINNSVEYLNITSAGAVTLSNLAGTGSRAVLADANGLLSAPVSDFSVKQNIQPLNYGLNTIMQLRPVSFEYIDGWKRYGQGEQIGFIAQDINKILPNSTFVTPSTSKMGYNEIDLVPILVKAVQEQQDEIDILKKEIKKLKHK